MVSFLAKVKISSFWPKTMDCSQAFLPNLSLFFEAFLLLAGRCYETETCATLLLLRCAFCLVSFLAEVRIFGVGPVTMHGLWSMVFIEFLSVLV